MNLNRPSLPLLFLIAGFVVYGYQQRAARSAGGAQPVSPGVSGEQTTQGPIVHTWQQQAPAAPLRAALRGRVVDLLGHGVAGVEVSDPMAGAAAQTGSDGRFELEVMRGKQVRLLARAGDGRQASLWTHAGQDPVLLLRPAARRAAEDSALAGPLHLGEGVVQGAEGRVLVTVAETGVQAAAEEGGRFEIPVPTHPFTLIAHDESGRVARSAQIAPPGAHQARMPLERLDLKPGLKLVGTLRRPDGAPAPDAALELEGPGPRRQLRTSESGFFTADGLLPGVYQVTALPTEGLVGVGQGVELAAGAVADLEMQLRPERPLELQVVDGSGLPLPDVLIEAGEVGYLSSQGRSDGDGRVVLRGLSDGEIRFRAFRGDADALEELPQPVFEAETGRLILR